MGFLDALFGRPQLKKPDVGRLFALPAAGVTLAAEAGLQAAGRAGVCLKAVDSGEFAAAEQELRALVDLAAKDFHGQVEVTSDELGFRWVIYTDPHLEELVNLAHLVATTMEEKGFGEQLLAAVFRYTAGQRPFYLIYNYKRGAFYPFAPAAGAQERDGGLEFRTSAILQHELPIEKDTARWYPLWNCPV